MSWRLRLWWWDRRCAIVRLPDRLGRWMLQSSYRPTKVCVPREDTIHDASLDRLAFECARRVSDGKDAQITVSRHGLVIVAAISVHDEATFDHLHELLKAELQYMRRSA